MEKLKVLLVDSSVITRVAMLKAINTTEYAVAERATSGGDIALEWLSQCEIDVILMDVMIIRKEGLRYIYEIKKNYPKIEIIVMSNDHPESTSLTLDALKEGALDFIQKLPEKELEARFGELKTQMQTLFTEVLMKKFLETPIQLMGNLPKEMNWSERKAAIWGEVDLILIASSTGGPLALDKVFSTLPPAIQKPILIVQHMPPEFTKIMAQKLQEKHNRLITEALDQESIVNGKILIAPGGLHMTAQSTKEYGKIIRLVDQAAMNGVKPSADILFQSVATAYKGKNILAVILTGMGDDGMRGLVELKNQCNCYCITQSEDSCVVYGMPKCVYDAGLSDEVADLSDIAYRIHQITLERGGH